MFNKDKDECKHVFDQKSFRVLAEGARLTCMKCGAKVYAFKGYTFPGEIRDKE